MSPSRRKKNRFRRADGPGNGKNGYLYILKKTHFLFKKTVISVLDLSDIFARERTLFPAGLEGRIRWDVMDFRELGGTMCFCETESAGVIRRRLAGPDPAGPDGREGSRIHWIDTGDYHYLTYFFLERIDRPFELLLFDNHPDDQPSVFGEGLLSCGGWVRTARERLPLLSRMISIGPEAEPSVWERCPDKPGGVSELPVYVSIDKDVLSKEFARTDWTQGEMTLTDLMESLEALRGREVLGVDICGGLTVSKGASDDDFTINSRTDSFLIDRLLDIII